jgi:hypothetical protein
MDGWAGIWSLRFECRSFSYVFFARDSWCARPCSQSLLCVRARLGSVGVLVVLARCPCMQLALWVADVDSGLRWCLRVERRSFTVCV